MNGQYRSFLYGFEDDSLVISSADPQIGELKRYPLHGSALESQEEAFTLAKGRIDLDYEELSSLEIAAD